MLSKGLSSVFCNHFKSVSLPLRFYKKCLTKETISPNVINAEYAVRGKIPMRGQEIMDEIKKGAKYPFDKTTSLNIGNPQAVGQGYATFNREVNTNISKMIIGAVDYD